MILIHDEDKPRGFWRLARVQRLLPGKDNEIRGAVLRVFSKNGRISTLQCPVQRLFPLEIDYEVDQSSSEDEQPPTDESVPSEDTEVQPMEVSRRPTAKREKSNSGQPRFQKMVLLTANAVNWGRMCGTILCTDIQL